MAFGFAWVGDEDTAFLPAFAREDEEVLSVEVTHSEGAFALLTIAIKNPLRRFLEDEAPLVWAWLSLDGAPIFYGRLVTIPEDMTRELVSLNFIARPGDYEARKRALAETLRVAPYWDPIWIADERRDDPDVAIEARPVAWHIDRISHAVTVSDLNIGEDGVVELGPGDFLYDPSRVSYAAAPLRRVRVEATVSWDQAGAGSLDITRELIEAFKAAGSTGGLASSFTGQGLEADWPAPDSNIAGGWRIGAADLPRVDGISVKTRYVDVGVASLKPRSDEDGAVSTAFLSTPYQARFFLWEFRPVLTLDYDARRRRSEIVVFDLEADVQSIVTEPGEDEQHLISLASRSVSEALDEGGAPPIGDVRRNSYMRTDRGRQSLEYLIMLARTKLLSRARAVQIEIAMPLSAGFGLSCRHSVAVNDPRLPGGRAVGKVIEYRLTAGGDGTRLAVVKIGCTIGAGNAVEADPGAPEYVDDDYVAGYQTFQEQTFAPGEDGGVVYSDLSAQPIDDDGINFLDLRPADVIRRLEVINGETAQRAALSGRFPDIPAAVEALNAAFTEVWLELEPLVGGPFETPVEVDVSPAMIPKTIDL